MSSKIEKSFVCEVCGASFAKSTNLKIHVWIHTGERQFQCEICKSAFSQLSGL